MAERVSKCVPIAERITEFGKEDFDCKQDLVIVDGKNILQVTEQVPIVVYQCNQDICYADIKPEPRLNSFILNIVVAICVEGQKYSFYSEGIEKEPIDFDAIEYYEDPVGIRHQIVQYDICKFLLKKPNLVVSEEGVLVFYTEDEILATTDLNQYAWVRWDDAIEGCTSIENITAYKEYCEITLIEGEDVYDDLGGLTERAPRHVLTLNFDLKVADHNMINAKLAKKS